MKRTMAMAALVMMAGCVEFDGAAVLHATSGYWAHHIAATQGQIRLGYSSYKDIVTAPSGTYYLSNSDQVYSTATGRWSTPAIGDAEACAMAVTDDGLLVLLTEETVESSSYYSYGTGGSLSYHSAGTYVEQRLWRQTIYGTWSSVRVETDCVGLEVLEDDILVTNGHQLDGYDASSLQPTQSIDLELWGHRVERIAMEQGYIVAGGRDGYGYPWIGVSYINAGQMEPWAHRRVASAVLDVTGDIEAGELYTLHADGKIWVHPLRMR